MALQKATLIHWFSFVGIHLIWAPLAFLWYYGNLSAYVGSYFVFGCSSDCMDGDTQWILALFSIGIPVGVFITHPLERKLGLKVAGIICTLVGCAALLGVAYTVQNTVVGTAVLSAVLGPCSGLSVGISFAYIHILAADRSSLFAATTSGFSAALAFVENELILYYINPDNVSPDTVIGEKTFFSQPELLERVPSIIMILAAIAFGCQAIGLLLITHPKTVDISPSGDDTGATALETTEINGMTQEHTAYGSAQWLTQDDISPCFEAGGPAGIDNTASPDGDVGNSSLTVVKEDNPHALNQDATTQRSWTLRECLTNKQFWSIFLVTGALGYSIMILNNYYKQFGLVYIPDDRFLTLVGSIIPLSSFAGRIFFGYMMDKHYLTVQDTMVISLAAVCLVITFWYFAAHINQYVYMFVVWAFYFFQSTFYVAIPEATVKLFGPEFFNVIYAVLLGGDIPVCFLSGFFVTDIINDLGWFWLFATTAIFDIASVVPVTFIY